MKILNPVTGNYEEISIKALDGMSIGMGVDYYGTLNNIPTGWLVCDGSAISRTEYAELFTVIGTQYGSGDGSTTFNLPNKCGKYGVGYDPNDSDFNLIGKTGGSKSVSYTPEGTNTGGAVGGHTLTANQSGLPSHTHTQTKQVPYGTPYNNTSGSRIGQGNGYIAETYSPPWTIDYTGGWNASESHDHPFTQPTFTGTAKNVNVVGPYEVQLFLIKAKDTTAVFASIYDAYSTSTKDGYACSYINEIVHGTILYENASGTSSNIVLDNDKSTADYNKIKIEYIVNDGTQYGAVAETSNGKTCDLIYIFHLANPNRIFIKDALVSINGVNINFIYNTQFASENSAVVDGNYIKITKIIGYK